MPPTAPRIRLLFSLSAALPFSENLGHPVFSWRASVPCGHLLGLLFRALGGRVEEVAEGEQGEPEGGEAAEQGAVAGDYGGNVGVPPPQATSFSLPHRQPPAVAEKPERVRSFRLVQKREKYLRRRLPLPDAETMGAQSGLERGSPDSGMSEGIPAGAVGERECLGPVEHLRPVDRLRPVEHRIPVCERGRTSQSQVSKELHRETKDVAEEAAVTLRNISTNFLSSLKYKKVSGCEREVRCLLGADLVTRGEDSATELAVRCNQLQRLAKAGKQNSTQDGS